MSSAFVKEGDDQWLHDIAPTPDALVNYLTRENGGLAFTKKKRILMQALKPKCTK